MKLLVMSDSHGNIERMQGAAALITPDVVLHLGDHIADAYKLQRQLPGIPFYMVPGNCDFHSAGKTELLLVLEGVTIYMTHGHICGVKSGFDALIMRARRKNADLVLFGHTHQAIVQETNGLWLMNPGQMKHHDSIHTASYGIVTIKDGAFDCKIAALPS